MVGTSSGPLATGDSATDMETLSGGQVTLSNISGGNTGIMGNMGSAGNLGGMGNPGPTLAAAGMANGGTAPTSRKRITASQVTGALKQAQTFQAQGRFNDAIDLCEQILESGFDRPDARYFLGWLYQEQRRWDEAIRQFQMLLNDPDYALSCYYALGQCHRARGDMRAATIHFDEAVDRVNLDALTVEESDQLVQLCQEAAEAHRLLGEQEQALTVYNALLGFLRSRGWNDKVAQVEFMLKQAQNSPVPARPVTPPPTGVPPAPQAPALSQQQGGTTHILPPEQMARMHQPPVAPPAVPDAATAAFNMGNMPNMQPSAPVLPRGNGMPANASQVQPPMPQQSPASTQPVSPVPQAPSSPVANNTLGELPDWLTGILNDADKTQIANKQASQSSTPPAQPEQSPSVVANQSTAEQAMVPGSNIAAVSATEATAMQSQASASWLTEGAKPASATPPQPSEVQQPAAAVSAPQTAPTAQEPPAPSGSTSNSSGPGTSASGSDPTSSYSWSGRAGNFDHAQFP